MKPEEIAFVANSICGVISIALAFVANFLWTLWGTDSRKVLGRCCSCNKSHALASEAQKFAVYWAIHRAQLLDSIMDKLGKTYAIVPFIIIVSGVLFQLGANPIMKLMTEFQPALYITNSWQIVSVYLICSIRRHTSAFLAAFPDTV